MLHFYETVDNDIIYCILELTMFLNFTRVITISILMMKSHFHILEAICNL